MDILTKELNRATDAVLRDSDSCSKEIEIVAESARTLFDLNSVLVVTNRNYRYQLTPLFSASRDAKQREKLKDVPLTFKQYADMVSRFKEEPLYDDGQLPGMTPVREDRLLRYGVMHGDHYYGHVVFAAEPPHEYTKEEKEAIRAIGQLVLTYFGMCHLREGAPKYNWENEKLDDESIFAAYYVNLEEDKCHSLKNVSFQQESTNEWMTYSAALDRYSESYTESTYAEGLRWTFGVDHLKEALSAENPMLTMEYPHLYEDGIIWIEGVVEMAEHDSQGNVVKAHLTLRDITDRKRRELEMKEISSHLEREHERVLKAKLQAMVDPLTEVYNRAGFERAIEQYRNEDLQLGLMMLDIDYFKDINDNYGHEFGDKMLKLVAEQLKHSFRIEDKVFRIGGDEFVLLLYGCGPDAFCSLQEKLHAIHKRLNRLIEEDLSMTLSAGFSQSDCGYVDAMISLADEALYHTKNNGRAGLTQVDETHQVVESWKEEQRAFRQEATKKMIDVGYGRIEFAKDGSFAPRLFIDEVSRMTMGISKLLSPEETYVFWKDQIAERNRELFYDMKARLMETGSANCIYYWEHPSKGEIMLRSGNKYRENGNRCEIFGYMQETKEEDSVASYEDGQFMMIALSQIYFSAYYFDVATKDFYVVKAGEYDRPTKTLHHRLDVTIGEFVKEYVVPEDREKVLSFMDFETLTDRLSEWGHMECEYRCRDYGRCRTRLLPVKWDETGRITHAVSLSESIEEES